MKTDTKPTSVAGRLLTVLDTFADGSTSLRLTDIANRSGLPVPTAWRMIGELVAWGGLERAGDGSYRLGARLWAIGSTAPCPRAARESGLPLLRSIAEHTGLSGSLCVLDDHHVRVIERVPGRIDTGSWQPGDRLPLHATAAGKALLAGLPAITRARLLADAPMTRFTPYTIMGSGTLLAQLDGIGPGGFAIEREECRLGQIAVAILIDLPSGPAAAMVAAPSTARIDRLQREIANAVRTAAQPQGRHRQNQAATGQIQPIQPTRGPRP